MLTILAIQVAGVLAGPPSAAIAQGKGLPTDPLPHFRAVALFKEVCPVEHAEIVTTEDERRLASGFEDIMQFEIGRAQSINPGFSATDARNALEKHIETSATGVKAHFTQTGCKHASHGKMMTNIKTNFGDAKKIAEFKIRTQTGVPYDKPLPFASEPGSPNTFAAPYFAKFLINGPLRAGVQCSTVKVTAVELISRTQKPIPQQPPHIRPQQQFVELWTWSCGDQVKRDTITFTQDDRSGRGAYSIKHSATEPKK